jgi:hypothetical protein
VLTADTGALLRSQVELLHPAGVTSLHIPGVTTQQQQQQQPGSASGPSSSSSSPDSSADASPSGRDSIAAAAADRYGLAQLHLADGRCLRSRLVVAADGARSQVCGAAC